MFNIKPKVELRLMGMLLVLQDFALKKPAVPFVSEEVGEVQC